MYMKSSGQEVIVGSISTRGPADPLEDYILGECLGHGSFATVRKAVSKPSGSSVAIKTYEKALLLDELRRRSVQQESALLSSLSHPNIVRLHCTLETAAHIHLVMEYIEGLSLHSVARQRENRRLGEAETRDIFRQIMLGVDYLHGKGVAHRDLKLQNVLLDGKKEVKIIDFGFATRTEEAIRLHCGTPSYMAPEIVTRKDYLCFPADIWAVGVLLYALLCGEFPFQGLNDRDLYQRIAVGAFILPARLSAPAKDLLSAMLCPDPQLRPIARVVLAHQWLTGVGKSTSQPILFRSISSQNGPRKGNPLDLYDAEVLARLRKLGYADLTLKQELQTATSHVSTLYAHLLRLKCALKVPN